MTVKVGELINQVKTVTAFGVLLSAAWILISFNIATTRDAAFKIESLISFHILKNYLNKNDAASAISISCLNKSDVGECRGFASNPWDSTFASSIAGNFVIKFNRVKEMDKTEFRRLGNLKPAGWAAGDVIVSASEKPVSFLDS